MRGLLVLGLLTVAGTASAQGAGQREFSAGWRYYHATISSAVDPIELELPNDLPKGWYADASIGLSPKFAVVGEVGGTYHSGDFSRTSGSFTSEESVDLKFHTFMGGIRVRAPQNPALLPFGQVLFGAEHDSSTDERTLKFSNTSSTSNRKGGSSSAVLALDGGVTIAAGPIGVRASVGYVRFFSDADADALRLSLGAAFRF